MSVLDEVVQEQLRTDLPELAPGDTVKVSAKVVEGTRERIQVFEGTVMRMRGGGITRAITVRRIASGVGVERKPPLGGERVLVDLFLMRHEFLHRCPSRHCTTISLNSTAVIRLGATATLTRRVSSSRKR